MLRYPRALRTLTICSALEDDTLHYTEQIDHEDFFRAISESPSSRSLDSFRVDFRYRGYVVVPAPGLDKLLHIKYLEIQVGHLYNKEGRDWDDDEYAIPDIDAPIKRLLPPNLEVLKITNYNLEEDEDIVVDILEKKSDIVPLLRRIVLTQHYRDREMADELRTAVAKEEDKRNYCLALQDIRDDFPCSIWRDPMMVLKSHCKREGVELMLLWEDSVRKEILREGAGPAVWEIPEQIEVSRSPCSSVA
ncbi:hypothetical protein EG329_012820 [Mollisiaceae sp. DMI_Dod_QoI]|nr:hypothetical protein EG329_012820 [Helotiales sp. DMI_Dod_QoI]